MNRQKKNLWFHIVRIVALGTAVFLAAIAFTCLQSGWHPSGYRTSPAACPPGETDSRGYCLVFRDSDYVRIHHSSSIMPMFMHISRASTPGKDDVITTIVFSQGKFQKLRLNPVDSYPPQNRTDAFVQSVRDRRTELYSEMGWPNPNPPAIPPLKRP